MGGKQFREEQIIGVLKEAEAGRPIPEVLRKPGSWQGQPALTQRPLHPAGRLRQQPDVFHEVRP